MTFSYNAAIPQANDFPANSQPQMLTNFGSINDLIAVDHISFNEANGGTHEQVTVTGNNGPYTPASNQSVVYTAAGTAKPASPQLFWQNQDASFHFPIKAWGAFGQGATTTTQGWNIEKTAGVMTIIKNGTGTYTVILASGAVQTSPTFATFGIVASSGLSGSIQTNIDAFQVGTTNSFHVFIRSVASTPVSIDASWSFIVLQI